MGKSEFVLEGRNKSQNIGNTECIFVKMFPHNNESCINGQSTNNSAIDSGRRSVDINDTELDTSARGQKEVRNIIESREEALQPISYHSRSISIDSSNSENSKRKNLHPVSYCNKKPVPSRLFGNVKESISQFPTQSFDHSLQKKKRK